MVKKLTCASVLKKMKKSFIFFFHIMKKIFLFKRLYVRRHIYSHSMIINYNKL